MIGESNRGRLVLQAIVFLGHRPCDRPVAVNVGHKSPARCVTQNSQDGHPTRAHWPY